LDLEIKMKNIIISTILFFFCLSSANAFLAKTKEIDPEDYPFLLLAKDLQIYNIKLDLSGSAEKARLKKWINGVYDIKYEYDRRDSDDFNTLFFSVKLEIEKNEKDARKTYRDALNVITKTSARAGMPCREIKNIIKWGDQNYYAVRERNGSPVGLIFVGRLKNKIYTLIMAGLYSSDHSLITDLVIPKLQNIDEFRIKG
jgi:hypothetical protein